jgi:hypothetical protein
MNQIPGIKEMILKRVPASARKIVKSRIFIVIARAMGYDPTNECSAEEMVSNSII